MTLSLVTKTEHFEVKWIVLNKSQSDVVFHWFIVVIGDGDLSHKQYTQGDMNKLGGQCLVSCTMNSN